VPFTSERPDAIVPLVGGWDSRFHRTPDIASRSRCSRPCWPWWRSATGRTDTSLAAQLESWEPLRITIGSAENCRGDVVRQRPGWGYADTPGQQGFDEGETSRHGLVGGLRKAVNRLYATGTLPATGSFVRFASPVRQSRVPVQHTSRRSNAERRLATSRQNRADGEADQTRHLQRPRSQRIRHVFQRGRWRWPPREAGQRDTG